MGFASAQAWPTRPVRVIMPYQAGASTDVIGRLFADHLTKAFGQAFFVENRIGAGGNVGTAVAARAAPDGYTLLVGTAGIFAVNPAMYDKLGFDPEKDFDFVALSGAVPMVLSVNPATGIKSIQDLIDVSKTRVINVAIPNTFTRVVYELFTQRTGARLTQIPYKGSPTAMNDVLGGQVQATIDAVSPTRPQARAGKLLPLAITTAGETALMPGLKPLAAHGLPGFEVVGWQGFFAPRGTPKDIQMRINAEVDRFLIDPPMRNRMIEMGLDPGRAGSPEQLAAYLKADQVRWGAIIKAANIRAE